MAACQHLLNIVVYHITIYQDTTLALCMIKVVFKRQLVTQLNATCGIY